MIATVFVTQIPPEYAKHIVYDARGWPFFERSSAELIKPVRPCVRLDNDNEAHLLRYLWPLAMDTAVTANLGRRLPLAPERFKEELNNKRFTNNADVESVARLFEKTATQVLAATSEINLNRIPVRQGHGEQLAQTLALCNSIQKLAWSFTDMPETELHAILGARIDSLRELHLHTSRLRVRIPNEVGRFNVLQTLDLSTNELFGPIPDSIGLCVALKTLYLQNNAHGVNPRLSWPMQFVADTEYIEQ